MMTLEFLKLSEGNARITIFAAQSTSRTFNYQVRYRIYLRVKIYPFLTISFFN